jgi:hypothetical protein
MMGETRRGTTHYNPGKANFGEYPGCIDSKGKRTGVPQPTPTTDAHFGTGHKATPEGMGTTGTECEKKRWG